MSSPLFHDIIVNDGCQLRALGLYVHIWSGAWSREECRGILEHLNNIKCSCALNNGKIINAIVHDVNICLVVENPLANWCHVHSPALSSGFKLYNINYIRQEGSARAPFILPVSHLTITSQKYVGN